MAVLPWPPDGGQIVSMLALPANQIDLWFCRYAQINDAALLRRYRQLLSAAELIRLERFRYAADRQRYLVTRALVRTVLSRYAAVAPEKWHFMENACGKPGIGHWLDADQLGDPGVDQDCGASLSFNVSHTQGLSVLGVTRDGALGVDLENMQQGVAPLGIALHFFASAEAAALHALPADQRQQRFFQYWTLKEAYLKARGEGLTLALDGFSFDFTEPERMRFLIDGQVVGHWRFWQLQAIDDYLVAVCAEASHAEVQQLVTRQVVPLRSAQSLPCPLLAQT